MAAEPSLTPTVHTLEPGSIWATPETGIHLGYPGNGIHLGYTPGTGIPPRLRTPNRDPPLTRQSTSSPPWPHRDVATPHLENVRPEYWSAQRQVWRDAMDR